MFTRRKTKGFTLIELLVVIAIIAMLLAMLMPALSMAKDIARRVVCATQLKGFGTALRLYSDDYNDKAVPNANYRAVEQNDGIGPGYPPWASYIVGNFHYVDDPPSDFLNALQHGKLYSLQYLDEPDLYYCPAAFQNLKGEETREWDYYFTDVTKSMPPHASNGWGGRDDDNNHSRCRSNYIYWTWEETTILNLTNKPMVIDDVTHIGHTKGGRPYGLNAVFGDGHVSMTLISSSSVLRQALEKDKDDPDEYINTYNLWGRNYAGMIEALGALQP